MKKSTIWLLTIIMSLSLGILIYMQVMYMESMIKMRNEQFGESVKRCLYAVSGYLEREETLYYLEQDVSGIESSFYTNQQTGEESGIFNYSVQNNDGSITNYTISSYVDKRKQDPSKLELSHKTHGIGSRYQSMQEVIRGQYLYQRGLLNEVILTILQESCSRPALERADSTIIKNFLTNELSNNGVNIPFEFAVTNYNNIILYSTSNFNDGDADNLYSQILFPNSNTKYHLKITFPTKSSYIYSSIKFLIPILVFTLILLIVFLYTIILAFKQKKLTEIKNDFINNMTHEFKTPISTISLAAQMLDDDSVRKSTSMLQHISKVINDESKRLRFQVEKVLQTSMFDKKHSALNFTIIDGNKVISNVVNTFKIKVEKFGGSITTNIPENEAFIKVDEMHFTNVIFNLLDNAVKYMKEDTEPQLELTTKVVDNFYEIHLSDNGIGIKKDDLKRIFDKFYRVHTGNRHDVKGFGLGLAYVKKIVKEFNGRIHVESEFGQGTTFIIYLPISNENN